MDYTKVISTVKKYAFGIVDILKELYAAINQGTEAIKTDVAGVKTDVAGVKTDVAGVKTDVAGVKTDVAEVKSAITAANQLADQINGEVI